MRGIIDANRADMASAGLPVFAHPALPEEFADELARRWPGGSIANVLKQFDPPVRQSVAQQLLGRGGPRVGAGDGRFSLLGGGEDDGPSPPRPAPRGAKPTPPMPRPNPMRPERQREAGGEERCAILRRYILLGRNYRKDLERQKADLERQINSSRRNVPQLERRRENLRNHLADLGEQLGKFQRGAWVGDDGTPIECPPDIGPAMPRRESPWPGRKKKERRQRTREAARDTFCEALAEGVESGHAERRRNQRMAALQNEIRQVEAELRNLDTQIASGGHPRPDIQAKINQIEADIHNSLTADKADRDEYRWLGCAPAGIAY